MSRAYRIKVAASLERTIRVEDGVQSKLSVLPVLSADRMARHLRAELAKRGFEQDGSDLVRTDEDGIEVRVDPATLTVGVCVARQKNVELSAERTRAVADKERGEAELKRQLADTLESQAGTLEADLQADVTTLLERRLRDIQQELDDASTRVTATALKERAAELGEVQEVLEDAETGAVTIRVRV